MEKYIALLRGVNVGGKNKVSMPSLKAAFEEAGFSEVGTYINSGNIIFSAEEDDIVVLQQKCRQAIMDAFHLDIAVAVLSAKDLSEALDHAPAWWDRDSGSKHNAIFVIAPANPDSIIESVGRLKPEYEQVSHYGRIIFWSAPLETFSRTRWSKIVSTPAYGSVTIRNANTARKLSQLSR
jgi:uncharacterized protein (DUF1697 family)